MDGTNTVQMILDLLAKKYGENHRTAITADMGIVLSTFLSLKLIIFKKGEFPTMDGITMPLNVNWSSSLHLCTEFKKYSACS